jgi:hypothetical protein
LLQAPDLHPKLAQIHQTSYDDEAGSLPKKRALADPAIDTGGVILPATISGASASPKNALWTSLLISW